MVSLKKFTKKHSFILSTIHVFHQDLLSVQYMSKRLLIGPGKHFFFFFFLTFELYNPKVTVCNELFQEFAFLLFIRKPPPPHNLKNHKGDTPVILEHLAKAQLFVMLLSKVLWYINHQGMFKFYSIWLKCLYVYYYRF